MTHYQKLAELYHKIGEQYEKIEKTIADDEGDFCSTFSANETIQREKIIKELKKQILDAESPFG